MRAYFQFVILAYNLKLFMLSKSRVYEFQKSQKFVTKNVRVQKPVEKHDSCWYINRPIKT